MWGKEVKAVDQKLRSRGKKTRTNVKLEIFSC